MTKEPSPIEEGQIVAGKYLVGRVLGQGGMGVVVAATHLSLQQSVALKLLLPGVLEHPEVVTRFTREAQAAAKIQCEHVARVLDVGSLESGAPYMVMEYLEGEDLEQTLARRGPLPIAEAVDFLLQGCEAVAEAHSLGIVHRDLKPANLFLAKRPGGKPIVKVLDFGISKTPASAGNPGLTQTTSMMGSPPYMSPEQVRSTRSADARSDIWSLGAVLYELLTGRRAFHGESMPAIYVAILDQDPPSPRSVRPEIPAALDAAVMRCLQKEPALRYPDVAALASALGPFGLASSVQSVERIAHVLGVARPESVSSPLAARAPVASAGGTAPLQAAAPALAAPGPGVAPAAGALQTLLSPPTIARAGSLAAAAPIPVAATGQSSRGNASRVTLAAVALLAVGGSGAAYWLGARRAQGPSDPRPVPHEAPAVSASAAKPPAPEKAQAPTAPPGLAAARSTASRHATPASKQRERRTVAGNTLEAAATPPADELRKSPAAAPAATSSTFCADLLERESLGEPLTPKEKAAYARQCNR